MDDVGLAVQGSQNAIMVVNSSSGYAAGIPQRNGPVPKHAAPPTSGNARNFENRNSIILRDTICIPDEQAATARADIRQLNRPAAVVGFYYIDMIYTSP